MILDVKFIKFNKEIRQKVYCKKNITFPELVQLLKGKQNQIELDIRDIFLYNSNERYFYDKKD